MTSGRTTAPVTTHTFPASPAQRRLWFVDRLVPGYALYMIHATVPLGAISPRLVQATIDELVDRHETLRTTFTEIDGEPVQAVHTGVRVRVHPIDLIDRSPEQRAAALQRLAADQSARPFDLSRGPLLRVGLVRLEAQRHVLLLTIHHIVADGWSMTVFFNDFTAIYGALAAGRPSPLSPLAIQYADFAVWQADRVASMGAEQLDFWRGRLVDAPTVELEGDHARPATPSFSGVAHRFTLPPPLVRRLEAVARAEGATLFVTVLAAYFLSLRDYSGQDDLVVGVPVSGRDRSELEPLIGFFVNMLVIRSQVHGDESFRSVLGRVRSDVLQAMAHQDVPFDRIVEELHQSRDLSRHPLFQIAFQVHQRPDMTDAAVGRAGVPTADVPRTSSNFDLHVELWPEGGGLVGRINFATDLFDLGTIRHQAAHYRHVLEQVAADPDKPIDALDVLGDTERRTLMAWAVGAGDYRRGRPVHALVEAEVDRRPGAVALRSSDGHLTYAQLDARANGVANALLSRGLRPQEPVGVIGDRSLHLVPAMLGVLKAGGAYVGIEPGEPVARSRELLARAGCRFVLAHSERAELLAAEASMNGSLQMLLIDGPAALHHGHPATRPDIAVHPDHAAYISFTSGSTGSPKGAAVTHRGVARLVTGTSFREISSAETFLMLSTIAFDAAVMEVWGPLTNGASLVVHPPGPFALNTLADVIRGSDVTTLFLTAGLFHQFVDEELDALSGVTTLISGGDVLSADHIRRVLALPGERTMINAYGPTENASYTTCYVMTDATAVPDRVPIGRPLSGTTVYVLDPAMRPVPIGAPGELWTGGDGLAQGYVDDPASTAAAFVEGPFEHLPDARLYRTGDRARWRADGTLEFLGRADRQVKIRGFRVEPAEVEAALTSMPRIREAAVLVVGADADNRRLVAFVAPSDGEDGLAVDQIRATLARRLPGYLVPSTVCEVPRLPLMPNGKLDRRNLLEHLGEETSDRDERIAPRTPAEAALAPIWAEVLGIDDVGVTADFFSDLGGHSLLATRLVARVRDALDVDLPLRTLFESPDIAGMAVAVETLLLDEVRSEHAERTDRMLAGDVR